MSVFAEVRADPVWKIKRIVKAKFYQQVLLVCSERSRRSRGLGPHFQG